MRQQLLQHKPAARSYDVPNSSPLWALLGLRGVIGLHSERESIALQRHARGRKEAVEIGVAEGASARTLKAALGRGGRLTLIDPYPHGRLPGFSPRRWIARVHVGTGPGARVRWIKDFSYSVARAWRTRIDFLLIDGDHAYESCRRDFLDWSPFVVDGGVVAFHDARLFPDSWTNEETGSVRVVNELFRVERLPGWVMIDEVDSLVVVQRQGTSEAGAPGASSQRV